MENQSVLCGDKPSRISSCSTNELSFDSDIEDDKGVFKVNEESNCTLSEDLDYEIKCLYGQLNQKLESVYLELEKELEPVCIREFCVIPSRRISITGTSGSLISRRRVSMSTLLHKQ